MEFELKIDDFKKLCSFIKDVKGIENIDLKDIPNHYDEFLKHESGLKTPKVCLNEDAYCLKRHPSGTCSSLDPCYYKDSI